MAEPTESREFHELLAGSGCDATLTGQCERLHQDGMTPAVVQLLERHRAQLLGELRGTEDRLECLDRLIHSLTRPAIAR